MLHEATSARRTSEVRTSATRCFTGQTSVRQTSEVRT
jgi:hypothetical protein